MRANDPEESSVELSRFAGEGAVAAKGLPIVAVELVGEAKELLAEAARFDRFCGCKTVSAGVCK